jgi:cell division septal protein FtsQ
MSNRRPVRSMHRPSKAAERAVRAAAPPRPLVVPPFAIWVLGRLLALGVLMGAAWIVYDSASSDRFQVQSIHVQGNVLLSQAEIERTAAVRGTNVFWVDRDEVADRVRSLPLVERADVTPTLPDTVDVTVVERQPAAFWVSGDQSYLVDREGVILKPVDDAAQQARACAGQPCDPRLAAMPLVAQPDGQPLNPGDRVDARALEGAARLEDLLPSVGVLPLGFEWSAQQGLEVPTRDGWRVRFNTDGDIEQQMRSLLTIREYLASTRTSATVIDVRFGDRPYYR